MKDLINEYKDKLFKKLSGKDEAIRKLEEMGIITRISKEELDRRIKENIPGTYMRNGMTIQIGGKNPFEPDDDDIF